MKIREIKYTKNEKDITNRKVLVLNENTGFFDSIDLNKLTNEEQKELIDYYTLHEKKMKPFIEKGFRRFSKSKTKILKEENK